MKQLKVKDIIEKLQKENPEALVWIHSENYLDKRLPVEHVTHRRTDNNNVHLFHSGV